MQPDLKREKTDLFTQRLIVSLKEDAVAHGVASPTAAVEVSKRAGIDSDLGVEHSSLEHIAATRRRAPSLLRWRIALLVGDTLLVGILFMLLYAFAPRFHTGWHVPLPGMGMRIWNARLTWIVLGLFSWSIALNLTRAQEMAFVANRLTSILRTISALAVMVTIWTGLCWLFFGIVVARVLWLEGVYVTAAMLVLCAWRVLLHEAMCLPRFRARAVIAGVNAAGEAMAGAFSSAKRSNVQVIGYIQERDALPVMSLDEQALPVLGGGAVLRTLIEKELIDMIIVAFENTANPALYQQAIAASQLGVAVMPMAVAYEEVTGRLPVNLLGDQWYGVLPQERVLPEHYLYWRKGIDLIFGLAGGAALLLMLPFLALLIVLDSPGPIFYWQERVGYRGRPFRILKFRSMRTDAECAGSAQWARQNDARVTRVGRFLRATHLDELPQVLNILRGEMSLIGPRPERQSFIDDLERRIPYYRFRLNARPGLTGWAQVKFPYASSPEDALYKLHYDLYYIKHQSLTLDILILLKTAGEVLLSRGR